MTLTQVALVAGVGVVATAWLVARAFTSSTTSVPATYRRLFGDQRAPVPAPHVASIWQRLTTRLGDAYAATTSGVRLAERRRFALRAAGLSIATIAARAVTAAVIVFVLAAVLAGAAAASGTVPVAVAVVAPPLSAVLAGWFQAASMLAAAEARHRQFRIEAGAYVSLVALCMTTQRTAAESINYAARIGTGHAFETINDAVRTAPQRGLRVWEAIEQVGVDYGTHELEDLAASIAHVSGIGAGVDRTVVAIATRMRQIALDDMQTTADKRTSAMFGPTILFVFGVIAFLIYPLAIRVLDALSTSPQ